MSFCLPMNKEFLLSLQLHARFLMDGIFHKSRSDVMCSLVCTEAQSYAFILRLRGDLGLQLFNNSESVKDRLWEIAYIHFVFWNQHDPLRDMVECYDLNLWYPFLHPQHQLTKGLLLKVWSRVCKAERC